MKVILEKFASSNIPFALAVALVVLGFVFLRNGAEYFVGTSGGAYWDNVNYCKTHRASQMKIYGELVSCKQILAGQRYCISHLDESLPIAGSQISCDKFLGVEEEAPSPYDAY